MPFGVYTCVVTARRKGTGSWKFTVTVINSAIRFRGHSYIRPSIIHQIFNEFIWNSIRVNPISGNSFIGFSDWLQFIGLIVKGWSLEYQAWPERGRDERGGGLCTLMVQGRCPWSRRRFGLRGNFGRIERPLNSIEIIHSAKYLYRRALFSRREGWRRRRRRRIFGGLGGRGAGKGKEEREERFLQLKYKYTNPPVDAHLETPPFPPPPPSSLNRERWNCPWAAIRSAAEYD